MPARYSTGIPRNSGECSHCGSPRLQRQYRINANDGAIPVWTFRCYDCHQKSLGALVMLPKGGTTPDRLDEDYRERRRQYFRKSPRYKGARERSRTILTSDRLQIRITIFKGKTKENPSGPTD